MDDGESVTEPRVRRCLRVARRGLHELVKTADNTRGFHCIDNRSARLNGKQRQDSVSGTDIHDLLACGLASPIPWKNGTLCFKIAVWYAEVRTESWSI